MSDQELRDKLAEQHIYLNRQISGNKGIDFKAGWDAARANPQFSEEMQIQIERLRSKDSNRLLFVQQELERTSEQLDQLRAEVEKLHKRLGVACLDHDLVHYLACGRCMDKLRADSEREQARLKEELSKIVTERDQLKALCDEIVQNASETVLLVERGLSHPCIGIGRLRQALELYRKEFPK